MPRKRVLIPRVNFKSVFKRCVVKADADSIPGEPAIDIGVVLKAMQQGNTTGLSFDTLYMECWRLAFDRPEFSDIPVHVRQ